MGEKEIVSLTIAGRTSEKESGLGVPGLIVEASDINQRHKKAVVSTDKKGYFKIIFSKKDSSELLREKPDIYISIYSPPLRLLKKAKIGIKWGTAKEKQFDFKIPRAALGHKSPTLPENSIKCVGNLSMDKLIIEKRGNYDIPTVAGFKCYGSPGSPSLLEQIQYVALPLNASVIGIDISPGSPVHLPGPINPYPIQPPIRTDNTNLGENLNINSFEDRNDVTKFVSLDSKFKDQSSPYPENLVVLLDVSHFKGIKVAAISVCPLQYDPKERAFLAYPNLEYVLKYELAPLKYSPEETSSTYRIGRHTAEQLDLFLNQTNVSSAKNIFNPEDLGGIFLPILQEIPYVIITDDYKWPDKIDSHSPTLDNRVESIDDDDDGKRITDYFEQLAMWKTQRGMHARVVTISDIVRGKWGNFASDTKSGYQARDLQEVIRNFLKYIHCHWKTEFVLLGGNKTIIPMRYLVAYMTDRKFWSSWDFMRNYSMDESYIKNFIEKGDDRTIPPRGCKFEDNKMKLCCDSNLSSEIGVKIDYSLPLSTCSGIRISFKNTPGDGNLGWYFADEQFQPLVGQQTPHWYSLENGNEFHDANPQTKVCHLIVEGDRNKIDDDYYWACGLRLTPSDFFYSVLSRKDYDTITPELGDEFDSNGNGLYGQFRCDSHRDRLIFKPVDNFNPLPDIYVGRAPVESSNDARIFVNKVMAYEKLAYQDVNGDDKEVDKEYLKRIIFGADFFDGSHVIEQEPALDAAYPQIPAGNFVYCEGANCIEIHLPEGSEIDASSHRLFLRYNSDYAQRATDFLVPHKSFANENKWYFISAPGTIDKNEAPNTYRYVRVEGPLSNIKPNKIIWNPKFKESASTDKEEIRNQMNNTYFPDFNQVYRFYADYSEFSWPPHIEPLRVANIRAALDNGCHFLSLSAHGGCEGCCFVWWHEYPPWMEDKKFIDPDFENDKRYFIAFADSCWTAQPDNDWKSLGERAVLHPNGGAVAYIGNTRVGFSGSELHFWKDVRSFGRLGPAIASVEDCYYKRYVQILYGDPEMPVWTGMPKSYLVKYSKYMAPGIETTIRVNDLSGSPLENHQVIFLGGWVNSALEPSIYETKRTGSNGEVSWIPPSSAKEVIITVTPPPRSSSVYENYKPFIGNILKADPGTIQGNVVNGLDGKPIRGALISAGNRRTRTLNNGTYTLTGIFPDINKVCVTAEGYIEKEAYIGAIGSQTKTINFRLNLMPDVPKPDPGTEPTPDNHIQ